MFFRSGKKSAQDVSLNEPIDTDKDGNALTILDTMAVDDTIVESIDIKLKSEKLYGYLQSALDPAGAGSGMQALRAVRIPPPAPACGGKAAGHFPQLYFPN